MSLLALVELLESGVFATVASVAFIQWRRRGGASAAWLFATFGALAVIVPLSWITDPTEAGPGIGALRRLVIVLLALFPYFLYRFTSTFWHRSTRGNGPARVATVTIVAASVGLPNIAPTPGSRPWWYDVYALGFILVWTTLSLTSASRLWRCGRDQPAVSRSRMRTLALAAIVLNLALFIVAGASVGGSSYVSLSAQGAGLLSAMLFLAGFAPPAPLRALWRRADVVAFRAAEAELMQAHTAEDVASIMLPHAVDLVGGAGAVLVDSDRRVQASEGLSELAAAAVAAQLRGAAAGGLSHRRADVIAVPLGRGWLGVTTTASTPFFGAEELHLLETLAHLSGLALERAELYDRERIAARELAEREWQLAEAQRTAHMGSYTWDLVTGAVAWSDEMYRILGFDPEEPIRTGSAFSSRIHPEDRDRVIEAWRAVRDTPHATSIEYRIIRPGEAVRWIQGRSRPVLGDDGAVVRVVGTLQDITEHKEVEETLAFQATHDALTLLPNRALFFDHLTQALARRARRPCGIGVLFLDVDGFKQLNDRLGHFAGDELLVIVAARLRDAVRPQDSLARFGGDEFVLLCEDVPTLAEVEAIATRMRRVLGAPATVGGEQVTVTLSVGIAFAPASATGQTVKGLLLEADAAMYRGKQRGGDRSEVFGPVPPAPARAAG